MALEDAAYGLGGNVGVPHRDHVGDLSSGPTAVTLIDIRMTC